MSTGALKMSELYGLLHVLAQPGMPAQADKFVGMVRKKVGTKPPTELEVRRREVNRRSRESKRSGGANASERMLTWLCLLWLCWLCAGAAMVCRTVMGR